MEVSVTSDSFCESSPVPVSKWKLSWHLQNLNYKSEALRTLKRGSAGQLEWEFQVSRQWRRVKWEGTPRDDLQRTSHHFTDNSEMLYAYESFSSEARRSLIILCGMSSQTSTVRICFFLKKERRKTQQNRRCFQSLSPGLELNFPYF